MSFPCGESRRLNPASETSSAQGLLFSHYGDQLEMLFARFNSRKEFFISLRSSCDLNVKRIQGMAVLITPDYNLTALPWH